jgi:tRNA-Thr(GGU) m(6)t(6)A37 methyltransferase TsaA
VTYTPIGVIHSGHRVPDETPIQPVFAQNCQGRIDLLPEYIEGLKDLEGFSHLILIYHFHRAGASRMIVDPFMDDVSRGVFATRHPCRPNPIGFSVVRLTGIEGATLHLAGVDILDGTPLLDIKPYTAKFDHIACIRSGWQDEVDDETARKRGKRRYKGS